MIPKFRAWDRYEEAMARQNDIYFGAMDHDDTLGSLLDCLSERYELMQSTGLKDKNGVEIFEGDIVLENGMQRVITFGEQRYEEDFGNLAYYIGFNIFTKWGYSSIDPVEHEVLGNIYENPELLEK